MYVIYNAVTTRYYRGRGRGARTHYATEATAKRARTINKLNTNEWLIAEADYFYANIEKQIERTNLMSGRKFMESVNTPYSISPASETYWCS